MGEVVKIEAVLQLPNPIAFHLTQQAGLGFILYSGEFLQRASLLSASDP
jgi:hypothetical protein